MIDKNKLDSQLMLDEGCRLKAYADQYGNLTVGVGRNLDGNPLSDAELAVIGHDARTLPITHDQALLLLHNDEMRAFNVLNYNCPWWSSLDDVRGRVLVDLVFNLGVVKFLGFHTFLTLMRTGKYKQAADDLSGTAWYSEVGDRGPRLVGMVATGEDYTA